MINDQRQHETPKERARVAAELQEEARQLTEHAMLTASSPQTSLPLPNGNGNGNGHRNGNVKKNGKGARPEPGSSEAERALAAFDVALAEQPASISLLLDRASHLGAMGRYAAARADLEQALLLEPANLTVRTALGIVFLRKGLWADAVPHLRSVVEAEGWSPTAWFYLGEALNHVDDLEGALAAYRRAAEIDPHHAKALYGQGVVLDRLRRPEDATSMYRRSREVAAR
ncbi:MAG TPA: tetratricopeptide repeat protein [Gemmatimonadales bacterium]